MSVRTNPALIIVLSVLLDAEMVAAQSSHADARAIVEQTGVSGGLCLVVGAASTKFALALADETSLYVQVLQTDQATAYEWGLELANGKRRERLGVRNAPFTAADYDSQLFNLVVVENSAALAGATLADIHRILVPRGVVVFRKQSAEMTRDAEQLEMQSIEVSGWAAALRRSVQPVEWRPTSRVKWRAGARAQWSSGWVGIQSAAGKVFYCERMEVPNNKDGFRNFLWARDACNGRVLWKLDLGTQWTRYGEFPLAASDEGKVYVRNHEMKLVCLDAESGEFQFEVPATAFAPGYEKLRWLKCVDGFVVAHAPGHTSVLSADGKRLWASRNSRPEKFLFADGTMFSYDGRSVNARRLKDGSVLWEPRELRVRFPYSFLLSGDHVHVVAQGTVHAVARDTGKVEWQHTPKSLAPYRNHFAVIRGELYCCRYHPYPKGEASDLYWTRLDMKTGKPVGEEQASGTAYRANMCAPVIHGAGDYLVYFFNVWVDPKSGERTYDYLSHPSCRLGTYFANGFQYNLPSRKAGPLQGISALAPADIEFDHKPGGAVLQKFSDTITDSSPADTNDWTMFRSNVARGNASAASPGESLRQSWIAEIGLGGRSFGEMHEQRMGLTQPVSAWGLVVVADIPAERIVALDAATGKQKWVFPVGARVDLSPALYNGLCLFSAKDGWVYCLDARTGRLRWRLLVPPRVRLIGGQDKLESQWPMVSDVMISEAGIGYVCAGIDSRTIGGLRAVAFKPETGEVVWSRCYHGSMTKSRLRFVGPNIFTQDERPEFVFMGRCQIDAKTGEILTPNGRPKGAVLVAPNMDDYLAGGISLPRNAEDRSAVLLRSDVAAAKTLAFTNDLSIGYAGGGGAETWDYKGALPFFAKNKPGREDFLWMDRENELVVDDIVLTPELIYAVGHYYRVEGDPELRVVSRKDGKLLKTYPVAGFPSGNGMSVADKKVFIATREGKLICFQSQP